MDDDSVEQQLRDVRNRQHILKALLLGVESWPEVLRIMSDSADASAALIALQSRFGIDQVQAISMADIQFRRVPRLERGRIRDELLGLTAEIDRLQTLPSSRPGIVQGIAEAKRGKMGE